MMSDLPLVSIITPVYNGAKFIEELIFSVKEQDYPNIEHIIIDDGSTDDGATVAILKKNPHLRWWSRENRGQYATMNEGLDAARGDIVCFISADDIMAKRAVGIAIQYLKGNLDLDGVYGDYEHINSRGEIIRPLRPFRKAPTSLYPYSLHISHSSLYLNRRALIANELDFDASLKYVGDYDWIVRILKQLHIGRIKNILSLIRLHESQTSSLSFNAMRSESYAVQGKLGVSLLWVSLFRKVLFAAKLIDNTNVLGIRSAAKMFIDRLRGS